MFEEFNDKLFKQPEQKKITLDLASNMTLNPDLLWSKLGKIDELDDKEIFTILKGYYNEILNQIFVSKDPKFINLFINPKFISTLTQVFYNVELTDSQKIRCNKMAYDYLVLADTSTKDEYTQDLLIAMTKTVNRNKIPLICALRIPESVATLMVMARYSSEKEIVNVKRLNYILMQQPAESMSEQLIVDIYVNLFDHILPVFEAMMFDVKESNTMSPSQAEIYGLITLASLDLMNELPINSIKLGLMRFMEDKAVLYTGHRVRLNLESCSPEDYPRLISTIDLLKSEGIYIL